MIENKKDIAPIERHPLPPFLPEGARILMLGSFPPDRCRWSMEFFYPNFQNDMWRIMGVVFYGNKDYFIRYPESSGKDSRPNFDLPSIRSFLTANGIAIYDTASAVRRLLGTASDDQLEIVERTDIEALLGQIPDCRTIVSTGGKSAGEVAEYFKCPVPKTGSCVEVNLSGRSLHFYRMPSTSRAYPMPLEQKASFYKKVFYPNYSYLRISNT